MLALFKSPPIVDYLEEILQRRVGQVVPFGHKDWIMIDKNDSKITLISKNISDWISLNGNDKIDYDDYFKSWVRGQLLSDFSDCSGVISDARIPNSEDLKTLIRFYPIPFNTPSWEGEEVPINNPDIPILTDHFLYYDLEMEKILSFDAGAFINAYDLEKSPTVYGVREVVELDVAELAKYHLYHVLKCSNRTIRQIEALLEMDS